MSNVRNFGATGDGTTDDTAALQHAINDGDGLIELPRGVYRIKKTLLIDLSKTSRISLCGLGGVAKILTEAEGPAITVLGTHKTTADPHGFRQEEWKHERMPMLKNLEIEGAKPAADGIEIDGVMQPTITGVLIRQVRNAVRISNRARNLIIDHCHFYHNTGVGVFLDNVNLHQAIISDSHISYCRRGGIRIENSEIRNLQITGNDIEYNNFKSHPGLADEPTAEIYVDVGEKGTVREGTISSNTIQATYSDLGANIRFVGGDASQNHRAGMWTITGNLIGSQKNNIHLSSVRGVTISGNYIYSGHHRNILIENSRNIVLGPNCIGHNPDYGDKELATGIRIDDSENCVISGVLIEDARAGKHTLADVVPVQRDGLLELNRCRRVTVSGSQILNGTPNGIFVRDCEDSLLTGCSVFDARQPAKMKHAVVWKGNGDGNVVSNCRIGRGTVSAIDADESVHQANNHLD